jgi:phenylalanyl-tRNA synthetase beta chain
MNIHVVLKDLEDSVTFNYGMEYRSADGQLLAHLGSISGRILKEFDIDQEVFFADLDWGRIIALSAINKLEVQELPKFPAVRRDLALLVGKDVRYATLEALAYQTERKLLKEVDLFDVYEGKGIPDGKRSYALSFILRDENATLNDQTIDKTMGRLQKRFEQEVGAELRG